MMPPNMSKTISCQTQDHLISIAATIDNDKNVAPSSLGRSKQDRGLVPRGGSGESRYFVRWWHASCLPLPLARASKRAWRVARTPLARLKRGLLWPRRLSRSCPRLALGIERTWGEKHGVSGGAQTVAACHPLPLGPSCPASARRLSVASLAAHVLRMPEHV